MITPEKMKDIQNHVSSQIKELELELQDESNFKLNDHAENVSVVTKVEED